jgi:carbonic anhydrase
MSKVLTEVLEFRNHPLVPRNIPINGLIYDVHSGKLLEVGGAKAAGKAA